MQRKVLMYFFMKLITWSKKLCGQGSNRLASNDDEDKKNSITEESDQ